MKLKEIEKMLITHLQESGEIRESIHELKRSMDHIRLIGVTTLISALGFLLKVTLWK